MDKLVTALLAGKGKSKYDAVIGSTIDIPAPIFGVDIPDLYYRGTVLKKDPAHPGIQTHDTLLLVPLTDV